MTKHIPTPYHISEMSRQGFYLNDGSTALMAGSGDDLTHVGTISCQTKLKRGEGSTVKCEVRDDTAAFIVRACNAHEELVGALENLLAVVPIIIGGDRSDLEEAQEIAEAALAKARGEA